MIKKTLGGDRLGSGKRMTEKMHNFGRSNKNLSNVFASTMAPGVLYPAYVNVGLKGDTFDIDVDSVVRTIPTQGPLYGSFKFQVDVFQIPFRLYQAILHNNTTDIARKMNQVYLPKVQLMAKVEQNEFLTKFKEQIHPSSLMRYLRMSGLGKPMISTGTAYSGNIFRNTLAIPMLAYYDIFKNYYANKQEEKAYVIAPFENQSSVSMTEVEYNDGEITKNISGNKDNTQLQNLNNIYITGQNLNYEIIYIKFETLSSVLEGSIKKLLEDKKIAFNVLQGTKENGSAFEIKRTYNTDVDVSIYVNDIKERGIRLQSFDLSNIDDMRKYLLTRWDLGEEVIISQANQNYYPYLAVTGQTEDARPNNIFPLNGLVVKTYQSDMFNNWLDTEWVNEITETSAIDTSNGSFTLDTLAFKKKLYDHLNRLAISGGTYDDWQEATYGDRVWGKSEKPIYCGGMSSEVTFDEVVSTAATETEPLGTIGGRGHLNTRKGGKITIKVGEASVIMAIASLTPRIFQTQGNAWFNTELVTMDDLHKPIFDRIGFQDLIVEQMAWWDTSILSSPIPQPGQTAAAGTIARNSAGKQPAWLQYATDVDHAFGDFANPDGTSFMILSRNYEQDTEGDVKDVTTYIDPRKFNYAFVYKELDAQNFWVFINFRIHARRKMSNTQIPTV